MSELMLCLHCSLVLKTDDAIKLNGKMVCLGCLKDMIEDADRFLRYKFGQTNTQNYIRELYGQSLCLKDITQAKKECAIKAKNKEYYENHNLDPNLISSSVTFKPDEFNDAIKLAKNGDEMAIDYIMNYFEAFVRQKAKSYFIIGADKEDVRQEGRLGLYKAIRDYRFERKASFRAFAEMCITRQIITAIKTATRQKHIPLNKYDSFYTPIYDDSDRCLADVYIGKATSDPCELMILVEMDSRLKNELNKILSDYEKQVMNMFLDGYAYEHMAKILNRHVKSIDNAIQRIRRKADKVKNGNNKQAKIKKSTNKYKNTKKSKRIVWRLNEELLIVADLGDNCKKEIRSTLTKNEKIIFDLLCQNCSCNKIAELLKKSVVVIQNHIRKIYNKINSCLRKK